MSVKLLPMTVAAIAGLSLAACTNGRPDVSALSIAKSYVSRTPAPVVNDPNQIALAVNEALTTFDGPVALATFEKTNNNVVLYQIETNGAYRTWSSWSSVEDRRSVTTKNGVITATRGLRSDLMSSDVDGTLALLSSRSGGTATRVQRYLNGENQIEEVRAECTISRGGQTRVQVGQIDRTAVEMVESCNAGERSFKNIYRVDGNGRVLQSVQWLNDVYGTTVVQALR